MGQVEQIMIDEHQRFMPVIDRNGRLVGAITRTDLLRSLHEERFGRDWPGPIGCCAAPSGTSRE